MSTLTPLLLQALQTLMPHVLHYASMQHAHPDAHRDAAEARALLARAAEDSVAAAPRLTTEQIEKVDEAIRGALGDVYDCIRVWEAWSYGTMGPGDFSLVAEDSERVAEIRNAALGAIGLQGPSRGPDVSKEVQP